MLWVGISESLSCILEKKSEPVLMDGVHEPYPKEVRLFLSNLYYRQSLCILCPIFYYQTRCVKKWNNYLLVFVGRKVTGGKIFIGVFGVNFANPSQMTVWVSII